MTGKEIGRNCRHAATFGPGDRVGAAPELDTGPCFHFNEHNRWTIGCDNVDFAASPAVSRATIAHLRAEVHHTRGFLRFLPASRAHGHAAPGEQTVVRRLAAGVVLAAGLGTGAEQPDQATREGRSTLVERFVE